MNAQIWKRPITPDEQRDRDIFEAEEIERMPRMNSLALHLSWLRRARFELEMREKYHATVKGKI